MTQQLSQISIEETEKVNMQTVKIAWRDLLNILTIRLLKNVTREVAV